MDTCKAKACLVLGSATKFEGGRLVSRATKEVFGLGRGVTRGHGCLPLAGTCETKARLVLGSVAEFEARTLAVF